MYWKVVLFSIIQLSFLLFVGWINNKIFEMIVIDILFFFFRSKFEKQFHAKNIMICTFYSIIVFFIVGLLAPSKSVSLILIVLFTYSINQISFYVRDYLDLLNIINNKKKKNNIIINKGINKELLLDYCNKAELNELEKNILVDFYCNRFSIGKLAIKNNYSYDNIYIIKKKSLNKIRECFK